MEASLLLFVEGSGFALDYIETSATTALEIFGVGEILIRLDLDDTN